MESCYGIIKIVSKIQLELQTVITMAQKHMQWERVGRTTITKLKFGGWAGGIMGDFFSLY